MTREELIQLAQEAGFELDCCSLEWHNRIERFAALVTAPEREACARVCEDQDTGQSLPHDVAVIECAAAIRARGQK